MRKRAQVKSSKLLFVTNGCFFFLKKNTNLNFFFSRFGFFFLQINPISTNLFFIFYFLFFIFRKTCRVFFFFFFFLITCFLFTNHWFSFEKICFKNVRQPLCTHWLVHKKIKENWKEKKNRELRKKIRPSLVETQSP